MPDHLLEQESECVGEPAWIIGKVGLKADWPESVQQTKRLLWKLRLKIMGIQVKDNNKTVNTDVKQVEFNFTYVANGKTLAPILQLYLFS